MILNSSKKNIITICITTLMIIFMIAISVFVYGASISKLCIFAGYILCYVQLFGLALLSIIKMQFNHKSTFLAVGFFTGWAGLLLLYFISNLISTDLLILIVPPVTIIVSFILYLMRSHKGFSPSKISFQNVSICLCISVVLTLLYALLNTQYQYLSPEISELIGVNPDKAYHMGLIDSLSHSYPLKSLWIQGRNINYHFFAEILFAIPVKLFGLTADFILLSCGPYLTTYILSLSFYSFYQEMSSKANRAGLYCLLTIISSLYIGKAYFASLGLKFILENDNSMGYGISVCVIFIILTKYFYRADIKIDENKFLVLSTFIMMLATGIKGPVGAVLLAGLWGTTILSIFLKKSSFKSFKSVLFSTIGFVFIYVFVLGSKGQSNSSGESIISLASIADISFWKAPLVNLMKSISVPSPLIYLLILVIFIIFFYTTFCIPFCVGYIRELILVLSKKKEFQHDRILVYACSLVGIIAMLILNYSGNSQIYFGLVSAYLAPIISFWLFEDLSMKPGSKKTLKTLSTIFAVCIVATSMLFFIHVAKLVPVAISHSSPSQSYPKYISMTQDEYSAMKWLEKNTPDDSLLATDRYYSVPLSKYTYQNRWNNRFFLYASYSNRFCYISGSGYNLGSEEWPIREKMINTNNKLYNVDYTDRGKLAKSLGIDYVVVSKRFTKIPNLENNIYKECYANDDIIIYEIK